MACLRYFPIVIDVLMLVIAVQMLVIAIFETLDDFYSIEYTTNARALGVFLWYVSFFACL